MFRRAVALVIAATTLGAGGFAASAAINDGPPPGATAVCKDGTYSFSQTRSGTCSHHGGVATWLTPTATNAPPATTPGPPATTSAVPTTTAVTTAAVPTATIAVTTTTVTTKVATTRSKTCRAGYVLAHLSWGDTCLRAGEFCKIGNAEYLRYGFTCPPNGHLKRRK
jgi:hypothetical protein